MELLLNLSWLAVSVVLGVILLKSRGRRGAASAGCIHPRSAAWISYLILIAMLLPVISMTDDLQAMVTPSDGEQIVRRFEMSVTGHFHLQLHPTTFLSARKQSFASVPDAGPLEAVRDFYPSYRLYRQTMQGRAPPISS